MSCFLSKLQSPQVLKAEISTSLSSERKRHFWSELAREEEKTNSRLKVFSVNSAGCSSMLLFPAKSENHKELQYKPTSINQHHHHGRPRHCSLLRRLLSTPDADPHRRERRPGKTRGIDGSGSAAQSCRAVRFVQSWTGPEGGPGIGWDGFIGRNYFTSSDPSYIWGLCSGSFFSCGCPPTSMRLLT